MDLFIVYILYEDFFSKLIVKIIRLRRLTLTAGPLFIVFFSILKDAFS